MTSYLRLHRRKHMAPEPPKDYVEEECEHEWEFRSDWGGNPDVPNGTFDASTYYCPKCDTEQSERPDDYEEPFNEPYEEY